MAQYAAQAATIKSLEATTAASASASTRFIGTRSGAGAAATGSTRAVRK